eukprot:1189338-Pleurochrysis_carterae.AAC.1
MHARMRACTDKSHVTRRGAGSGGARARVGRGGARRFGGWLGRPDGVARLACDLRRVCGDARCPYFVSAHLARDLAQLGLRGRARGKDELGDWERGKK